MTLILSGTDGLSDVDGTAATPAIRGTDTNTGIFFPAADTIAFSEGGSEIARFDSNGNFGIGASSLSSGAIVKFLQVENATSAGAVFNAARKYSIYSSASSTLVFYDETGAVVLASIDSSGNFQFNSGFGSSATAYGCRSWVNFNGTGTIAIRGSGNVSSITDNGTGDYTINFTNAMSDANYSAVCTGENTIGATRNGPSVVNYHTLAAGSLRILTNDNAGTALDFQIVCTSILR